MSKTTKRKHVTREVLDEFVLPEGSQQIVKVSASKGNNLHEVVTAEQEKFLVSMPNKFRKNVWIKRGDFVIIEPIEEGCKVKAEIVRILYPRQVKYIQKEGKWPEEFTNKEAKTVDNPPTQQPLTNGVNAEDEEDDEDEDDDSDLFINTNRPVVVYYSDSSSDEDDSGQEDDVDDNECR